MDGFWERAWIWKFSHLVVVVWVWMWIVWWKSSKKRLSACWKALSTLCLYCKQNHYISYIKTIIIMTNPRKWGAGVHNHAPGLCPYLNSVCFFQDSWGQMAGDVSATVTNHRYRYFLNTGIAIRKTNWTRQHKRSIIDHLLAHWCPVNLNNTCRPTKKCQICQCHWQIRWLWTPKKGCLRKQGELECRNLIMIFLHLWRLHPSTSSRRHTRQANRDRHAWPLIPPPSVIHSRFSELY